MEFGEKLQHLRKSKGMTQEELAQCLYVSRTAVSKWESGRGYPSIDSIKQIASFFSVTIDELLTGEKILSLAEKENRTNIQRMCSQLLGWADLSAVLMVLLPLYPAALEGHIHSVSLLRYTADAIFPAALYWVMFAGLILTGIWKLKLTHSGNTDAQNSATRCSMVLGTGAVLLLCITRQVYATVLMFALLILKGLLILKHTKS